jgi:MFS family permease
MVAWGIVMTLMGTVNNYAGLLSTRLFLGVAEAGLFPGVAYFISGWSFPWSRILAFWLTSAEWYVREEMQYRQALFFSAASVAGAFSGLLAYAIAKMDGVGGYAGWRWIFILEGLLTVIVGVASFWTLYDFPDTASFLTTEERAWVVHRLRYQGASAGAKKVAQANSFKWSYVRAAFVDPQIYVALISKCLQLNLSPQTHRNQCIGVSLPLSMGSVSSYQPSSGILATRHPLRNC